MTRSLFAPAQRRIATIILVVCLMALFLAGSTVDVARGAASDLSVDLAAAARLVDRGQAAILSVDASCPKGYEVLEAFAYVSQRGNESDFAFMPLQCDGEIHRFKLQANAFDEPFREGRAFASGYVLIEDPETGETQSASDSRLIALRR